MLKHRNTYLRFKSLKLLLTIGVRMTAHCPLQERRKLYSQMHDFIDLN